MQSNNSKINDGSTYEYSSDTAQLQCSEVLIQINRDSIDINQEAIDQSHQALLNQDEQLDIQSHQASFINCSIINDESYEQCKIDIKTQSHCQALNNNKIDKKSQNRSKSL